MYSGTAAPISDTLKALREEFQQRYIRARFTMILHTAVSVFVVLLFSAYALLLQKDAVRCLVAAVAVLGVQSLFAVPHAIRHLRLAFLVAHLGALQRGSGPDASLTTQVLHALVTLQHSSLSDPRVSTWVQTLEQAYSHLQQQAKPSV